MDRTNNGRAALFIALLLGIVTLATFWPAVRNGFVSYDDPDYVTKNPMVLNGLTWEGVKVAFESGHAGNWHPLTWISHMADCQFYGLKARGHHLTNVVLHAVTTVLLFWVLLRMTGAPWRSGLVAALFGLHPLHVESVAWVAERKDVLSGMFFVLTLLAWTEYIKCEGRSPKSEESPKSGIKEGVTVKRRRSEGAKLGALGWHFAAVVLFALGLMSKAMLVTLPLVLLLLDFWPLQRVQFVQGSGFRVQGSKLSRLLLEKVPFLVLAGASSVITFLVQQGAGAVSSLTVLPLGFRISNAIVAYVLYAAKMLWPLNLAVFYPPPKEYPLGVVAGAGLLLLFTTAVVVWKRRTWPHLLTGWFWFLGMLVPVIGIVQVGQQAMADRYSYLPHIGLFLMLAWSADRCLKPDLPAAKIAVSVLALGAVAGCVVLSRQQLSYWKKSASLYEHALAVTKDNWVAQNNLGATLLETGKYAEAEPHLSEAVRIKPGYAEALVNLALCRQQSGHTNEALDLLERGVERGPKYALGHYNLANMLSGLQRFAEAEAQYQTALALSPGMPEAWYNLGILKERQRDPQGALECYRRAVELRPDYVDVHLNLGILLIGQGKLEEGIAEFETAKRYAPENADLHFNLASALVKKGEFAAAEAEFVEACRLRPTDLEARADLVGILMNEGKLAEAQPHLEQLLAQKAQPQWHYLLALVLDARGQPREALSQYREAIKMNPKAAPYLNDLAWLLATSTNQDIRNGTEAVRLAEQACALSGGKEPRFWGTLDAAYAEAGRFEEAIKTASKTRELAEAAGQKELVRLAEERLALYRRGKPYRNGPEGQQ